MLLLEKMFFKTTQSFLTNTQDERWLFSSASYLQFAFAAPAACDSWGWGTGWSVRNISWLQFNTEYNFELKYLSVLWLSSCLMLIALRTEVMCELWSQKPWSIRLSWIAWLLKQCLNNPVEEQRWRTDKIRRKTAVKSVEPQWELLLSRSYAPAQSFRNTDMSFIINNSAKTWEGEINSFFFQIWAEKCLITKSLAVRLVKKSW